MYKYKIVLEIHGIPSEQSKSWGKPAIVVKMLHFWEALVTRRCDLVLALSPHILQFIRTYARRLELLPVFIDTNTYKRNDVTRATLRENRSWKDLHLVGLIGPFDYKWNEAALEFLEENLDKFDKRILFVVIGNCEGRKNLDRCYYAGFVEDLPGLLSCLDAVLVARRLSTSGPLNKILQSMSCSLPVFTTPQGIVGIEHAKNGTNIIVVEERDMPRTINSLLFNEELVKFIGANARDIVLKYYSHEACASRLVSLIKSVARS
jgi:glycosyltransferase involved in cell wall biosynthesis